jgi:predicted nucleotidyltransferase
MESIDWPEMRDHHRRAMERVVERFRHDERFLAVLLGGSVVRGLAIDTSDIDIMLVATDKEFAQRRQTGEFSYYYTEDCDYPGGYVDGKVLDVSFLREAADHGSEPTRASFSGVLIGFSRLPDLPELVRRIPVYQEAERAEKIEAFYGQIQLAARYFIPEGEKRHDPYLLMQSTANLCLYASRLVLAENRLLFPSHKRLMETLAKAPDQPERFQELIGALLAQPGAASAQAVLDSIEAYRDWGITFRQAVSREMQDSEWRWRTSRPDLADW